MPIVKLRRARVVALAIGALAAAMLLVEPHPSTAQQVDDLSQQEDLELKRQVLEKEELIRLLYSQGKYTEVIAEADALLQLDPNNPAARINKNLAERRLSQATADTQPAESGTAPVLTDPVIPVATPAPIVVEAAPPLQPRTSYSGDNFFTRNLRPLLIGLGIVLGVGVLVVIFLWWRNRREEKAAVAQAAAPRAGMATGLGGLARGGLTDFPTIHNELTRGADGPTNPGIFDAPTGVSAEVTRTDFDENTAFGDQPTGMAGGNEALPPLVVPPLASEEKDGKQEEVVLPPVASDSLALDNLYHSEEPPRQEVGSSLGIDYSDTDSPLVRSQAPDVAQTGSNPFGSAPVAPVAGRDKNAPPPVAPVKDAESGGLSFDVALTLPPLERSGSDQTAETVGMAKPGTAPLRPGRKDATQTAVPTGGSKPTAGKPSIDISAPLPPMPPRKPGADDTGAGGLSFAGAASAPPPPDATASMDPNAMSFNSLMFGGEQTNNPAAAPQPAGKPAEQPEDLTLTSFNREFSNVMFGAGAEETKAPGFAPSTPPAGAPAQPASATDSTRILPPKSPAADPPTVVPDPVSGIALDATATAPPAAAPPPAPPAKDNKKDEQPGEKTLSMASLPGGMKMSMFERQRDAGKRAMDMEDYARAVQCFSVAANLKPNDQEVKELLEEARKKRRG